MIDGQPVDAWPAPVGGPLDKGPHHARLGIQDGVGNRAHADLEFVVDNEGPVIQWRVNSTRSVEVAEGTVFASPVELEVTAVDEPAGVTVLTVSSAGSTHEIASGSSVQLTGSSATVSSTDAVDNRTEVIAEWLIDDDAPTISLTSPNGTRHEPGETVEIKVGESVTIEAVDRAGVVNLRIANRMKGWFRDRRFKDTATQRFEQRGTFYVMARTEDGLGHEGRAEWKVRVRGKK